MSRSFWRVVYAVAFLLGAGGLGWLLYEIGLDTIAGGLAQIGPWFGVACAAHLCAILMDALTLRGSAGPRGDHIPYGVYARASLAGHGINQATPLGKVGELIKIAMVAEYSSGTHATGTLIVENFVMFVVNCTLIGVGALIAWLSFDVAPDTMTAFWITAGVFLVLGAGAIVLMWSGVGDAPIRVARVFGVRGERAERWTRRWREVRDAWSGATASGRHMRLAFGSSYASRVFDIAESVTVLTVLGVDQPVLAAIVSVANYQVVFWLTSFVPMQAGTAEGSAYVVFEALGLPGAAGVLLELTRKARRIVFVAIALGLVGLRALRADAQSAVQSEASTAGANDTPSTITSKSGDVAGA